MIRAIQADDYKRLHEIWELFYKDEFPFPDFITNYLCTFVTESDNGQIICASGIRMILESVALTDKRASARVRRKALYEILNASSYLALKNGFDQIHAFTQDENWHNQLMKKGFGPTKGSPLVLNLI